MRRTVASLTRRVVVPATLGALLVALLVPSLALAADPSASPAPTQAATPRPTPGPDGEPATTTPIKHFLVLMQENHSFDNYFGTYPGADGIPADTCMPVDPEIPEGECIEPHHLGGQPITDLLHNMETFERQYRDGAMDGFVSAHRESGGSEAERISRLAMGYYDERDLPFYWNIADEFVLFDRMFSSAAGGSVWNHMYWVTGTPGDPDHDSIPEEGFGDLPTIFDSLEAAGISWKFYVQNYDSTINYRTMEHAGDKAAQAVFAPILGFDRFLDDPYLFSHIVDIEQYYKDLQEGTLPAVAFMAPLGSSEHPPGSIQAGAQFVRTLINALMRSDYWEESAFVWTYDDWGGWYDHVSPPQVDAFGYGFRVPGLLVSPYAKKGHIDSTTLDYTSFLKFIEENWGLAPLAQRDAQANNFLSAFDFTQQPRPPVFLAASRDQVVRPEPNRAILYGAYATAFIIAIFLLLAAAIPGPARSMRTFFRAISGRV